MGWSVYVALTRDRPLSQAERRTLVALVAEHNREPWEVESFDLLLPPPRRRSTTVAYGSIKLPRDSDHGDIVRLLDALTAVHGLIEGAICTVADDDSLVSWEPGGYELALGPQPAVVTPETRGWQSARALAKTLAATPAHRLRSAPSSSLDAALHALAAFPANRSATNRQETQAQTLIATVAGDPDLRTPLLEIWRQGPAGIQRMSSLRAAFGSLAGCEWFRDELLASVARAGQPGEHARSVTAADMLREAGDARGLAAVLTAMRRYRHRTDSFVDEPPIGGEPSERTISALMFNISLWSPELSPTLRAAAMATCILALASPGSTEFVIRAAIKLGRADALPYLERVPLAHPHALGIPYPLPDLVRSDLGCLDRSVSLCLRFVSHPYIAVRIQIARALCELRGPQAGPLFERAVELASREGIEEHVDRTFRGIPGRPEMTDPALDTALARIDPLAEPVQDLTSTDRWHRRQGLRRYEKRNAHAGGPMLPMLLFEELDGELPAWERSGLPDWTKWAALPTSARPRAARVERAGWIRERATPAERAALPPMLRDVELLGAKAVAERFAAPLAPVIELSAQKRAELEAAERAVLGHEN